MRRWGLAVVLLCLPTMGAAETSSSVSISGSSATITSTSTTSIGADVSLVDKFEEALAHTAMFRGINRIQAKPDDVYDDGYGYITKTSYHHFFVALKQYPKIPPMLIDVQEVESSYVDSMSGDMSSSYRTLTVKGPLATYGGATPYKSAEKLLNNTFSMSWSLTPDTSGMGVTYLTGTFTINSPSFEGAVHQVLKSYLGHRAEIVTQQHMLVAAGRFVRAINEGILQ